MADPKNTHIWDQHGLTPEGARLADSLMPSMLGFLRELAAQHGSPSVAEAVFREATFQVFDLPLRTKAFQTANRWRGK